MLSFCTGYCVGQYPNEKNGAEEESKIEEHIEEEIPQENVVVSIIEENESVTEDVKKPTLYDTYTQDEIDLLFGVVEAETRGCEFDVQCNVVSVIFNRIESPRFKQNTIADVLLAPKQFSVVSNGSYKTVKVTDDTKAACEYVFEHGDTAAGALFFEVIGTSVHDKYATYIFNDGVHKFYK